MISAALNSAQPYAVPSNIKFVRLIVTGQHDPLPTAVSAFTHRSPIAVGLRLAGGCSGMSVGDKHGMLSFFGDGLSQFTGLVSSGGTRAIDSRGQLDPMVTDVPALLAAQSPHGVVAISTVPRTGDLGLVDDSRLVLDESGTLLPNPGVHMIVLVQSNNGLEIDWDGDLNMYFNMFENLVRHGGWRFGMVVYNGGGVTRSEALRAMTLGWPVILVRESGRQADILVRELANGDLDVDNNRVSVVDNGDWASLHAECVRHGLIAA
jgi:hypothetical protein